MPLIHFLVLGQLQFKHPAHYIHTIHVCALSAVHIRLQCFTSALFIDLNGEPLNQAPLMVKIKLQQKRYAGLEIIWFQNVSHIQNVSLSAHRVSIELNSAKENENSCVKLRIHSWNRKKKTRKFVTQSPVTESIICLSRRWYPILAHWI